MMKTYIYKVLLINFISIFLLVVLSSITSVGVSMTTFASLLVFFNAFYIITHFIVRRKLKLKQDNFSKIYMILSVIRLLVFLTLMVLLLKMHKGNIVFVVISILYFYMVFTINDVLTTMSIVKAIRKV